jgi:hypothetical protein
VRFREATNGDTPSPHLEPGPKSCHFVPHFGTLS